MILKHLINISSKVISFVPQNNKMLKKIDLSSNFKQEVLR